MRVCWPDIFVYDKLEEIAQSIVQNKRTTVRAGHGVGKSWLLARLAIWFLTVFKPSMVVTTAPTWTQVEKVLWGEISAAYHSSRIPLGGELLQTQWKVSEDCFAFGISTKEGVDQRQFGSTKFQGFHSPNLLLILDEAAGIPAEIWTAATSLITGENNKIIAIGNPTSPTGPFFDSHKSEIWNSIKISCFDHPNVKQGQTIVPGAVTKEWIEERKTEWGEGSPLYVAKVEGEFPQEGSDTLIPLAWAERAVLNPDAEKEGHKRTGSDIARYGGDETVIFYGEGNTYDYADITQKKSTTDTAGRIAQVHREKNTETDAVDDTGVGGGVTDQLREQDIPVVAVNFGEAAQDTERFFNLKAELYWLLREDFEKKRLSISDDPKLINQLASIKYSLTSKGQIKIESKDEMKKRGLKSPDRADALVICHYAKRASAVEEVMWM